MFYSVCVFLYIAPTAPRSLRAVDSTDTTVTLSWMPPDPPNGIITQYQVQYRKSDDSSDSFANNEVNTMSTDLTYTVTGLMTSTEYRFRVRAFTVVGRGDRSNIIDVFVGKLNIYQGKQSCQLNGHSVDFSE